VKGIESKASHKLVSIKRAVAARFQQRRSSTEAKKKMSTTSTKQFKVYAEVGDIMGFEVKVINHERSLVIGDLDTGEGCVLPFRQLANDRLDSLREPHGSEGGTEFNVRIIDAYTDSRLVAASS